MIWFKLVGATDKLMPQNWVEDRAGLLTKIHFPRNKRPIKLSNGERVILYAVGHKALVATQTVKDTHGASKKRHGPPGSDAYRWPWELDVTTHYYCSPIKDAPLLRDVAPGFVAHYAGKFWEGSHWDIEEPEYELLAAAIETAGRRYDP